MKRFLLAIILILCGSSLFGDQVEDSLKHAITSTTDQSKLYKLYKALGDYYAALGKKEEAEAAYKQMKNLPVVEGEDLESELEKIKKLGGENKLDEAIQALRTLTAKHPDLMEAHLLLALYLGWKSDFVEAKREIAVVLQAEPENREALLIKANILRWEGHNAEAILLYRSLLSKEDEFDVRLGLAWAELGEQQFEEVEKELNLLQPVTPFEKQSKEELVAAVAKRKKQPQQPEEITKKQPGVQGALSLAEEQKYEQANREIDALLANNPDDFEALLAKATILRWSKHFHESISIYLALLKKHEDFDARLGLAWAYWGLEQREETELNFKILSPKTAEEKEKTEELAQALKGTPRVEEESCENFQEKIANAKDQSEIGRLYKEWADCLVKRGNEKKAIVVYQKALALPADIFTEDDWLEMVNYLGTHETIGPAIAELETMLARTPENIKARILYARFLSWDKKFEDALRESNIILSKEPHNLETLLIKANTLRWAERYKEALPLYQEILAKEESFDARLGLTWDYIYLEQFEKAEENLALLHTTEASQIKEKKELKEGLEKEKIEAPKKKIEKAIAEAIEYAAKNEFYRALTKIYTLLSENPSNVEVKVALSKILSWSGMYCASLAWVRNILEQDPCNVEAMITGGNVLRWKEAPGSFCMYLSALAIDPKNFYAKLGLAYALSARTWVNSAYQIACSLTPEEESEKQDLADLKWHLPWRPALNFRFLRYRDSDDLDTRRYSLLATEWINDCQFDLLYRFADNTQPTFQDFHPTLFETSTTVEVDLTRSINSNVDVGGGIGYANIRKDSSGDFVVGNLRSNVFTDWGNFTLGSVYDVYVETAAALFFKIRTWSNYITYVNYLSDYTTVGGSYFYVKYSDANHSHRAAFYGKRKFYDKCFQIFAKYDFIFMDFESQPFTIFSTPSLFSGGHGYFDPQNYFVNQLTFLGVYEKKCFYFTGYPFVGYVTYHLLGLHYNGVYFGAGAILGVKFNRHLLTEITAEAARYPLTHLNYTYDVVTAWIKLAF